MLIDVTFRGNVLISGVRQFVNRLWLATKKVFHILPSFLLQQNRILDYSAKEISGTRPIWFIKKVSPLQVRVDSAE